MLSKAEVQNTKLAFPTYPLMISFFFSLCFSRVYVSGRNQGL